MKVNEEQYRVDEGKKVKLGDWATEADGGLDKDEAKDHADKLRKEMEELQEIMYSGGKRGLVVVLQGMDTAGKDSTIRRVFGELNPQGCRVTGFKVPSVAEAAHDYLWRVHQAVVPRGYIGIFNRSHYEDVLVVRVHSLVEKEVWSRRYGHINDFEKMLSDEGYGVVKFFLHISKDYQKENLQERLDNPQKHWKFDAGDLKERALWDEYQKAYEEMLERCSTKQCPWYIIPAERHWYRDVVILEVCVKLLKSWGMKRPEAGFDPKQIVIE